MKRYIVPLMATLLLATGCTAPVKSSSPESTSPTGNNTVTEGVAPKTEDTPSDTPEVPVQDTAKFGQSFTWEDGVTVTVSAPKVFKPTDIAAGTEGYKHFVMFTVVLVNKTGQPIDPSQIYYTAQSADNEASAIFDTDLGLEGAPETTLLNGRQTKFKIGFGVLNTKDVVLELTPGPQYNSVIWTTNG